MGKLKHANWKVSGNALFIQENCACIKNCLWNMKEDLYKLVLIKLTHNLKRVFKNYQNLKGELMCAILNPMPNSVPTLMVVISIALLILSLSFLLQSSLTISWQLATCPRYNLLNHDVGRCEISLWKYAVKINSICFRTIGWATSRKSFELCPLMIFRYAFREDLFHHNFVNSLSYPQVSKLEYPEFSVSKLETILSR